MGNLVKMVDKVLGSGEHTDIEAAQAAAAILSDVNPSLEVLRAFWDALDVSVREELAARCAEWDDEE